MLLGLSLYHVRFVGTVKVRFHCAFGGSSAFVIVSEIVKNVIKLILRACDLTVIKQVLLEVKLILVFGGLLR